MGHRRVDGFLLIPAAKRGALFLAALALTAGMAHAGEVMGVGRAKTDSDALRQAMSDIVFQIQVEVKSQRLSQSEHASVGQIMTATEVKETKTLDLKSDLPILGADINYIKHGGEVTAHVVLSTEKALPLYQSKLKELGGEITRLSAQVESEADNTSKYHLLTGLLSMVSQYRKHATVLAYLGGEPVPPGVGEASIHAKLKKLESRADSLELAAKLLAEGMKEEGIFVYPAIPTGSNLATQLGGALRDRLASRLKTVAAPSGASYFLKGEYEILKDDLDVTYRLTDAANNTLRTATVRLAKKGCQGYGYEPKNQDFARLLEQGVAVSSDVRVQVTTNKGDDGILFKEGEEAELLVKVNTPLYFYVAGHTLKEKEKYSYLMELREGAQGNRRFVSFVNADDVNKWISLGKFDTVPPFGVDSIQVVASTADPAGNLPETRLDKETGLYIISSEPAKAVSGVRALKKKMPTGARNAEAVLMFQTVAKGEEHE